MDSGDGPKPHPPQGDPYPPQQQQQQPPPQPQQQPPLPPPPAQFPQPPAPQPPSQPQPQHAPLPPASSLLQNSDPFQRSSKLSPTPLPLYNPAPSSAPQAQDASHASAPVMGPPLPPIQNQQQNNPPPMQQPMQGPTTPAGILWGTSHGGGPPPQGPPPVPQTMGPPPPLAAGPLPPPILQHEPTPHLPGISSFGASPLPLPTPQPPSQQPQQPTPHPLPPPGHFTPHPQPPQQPDQGAMQIDGPQQPGGGPPSDDGEGGGGRSLNVRDALSYLDQVKQEFSERADVYNLFLDIMKDFKAQTIDTPKVIERVSSLFQGHAQLIQGFNAFLPQGYRIETMFDPSDPDKILVTTPQGTTTTTMSSGAQWRPNVGGGGLPPAGASQQNLGPPTNYGGLPPSGQATPGAPQGHFNLPQPGIFPSPQPLQLPHPHHGHSHPLHAHGSHISHPPTPVPGGPSGQVTPYPPSEVPINHAMEFVNAIKVRYENAPDKYKAFLDILQNYQLRQRPIEDVFAQVHQLFDGQQDLIDEFQEFLPPSGRFGGYGALAQEAVSQLHAMGQHADGEPGGSGKRDDYGGGAGTLSAVAGAREKDRDKAREREKRREDERSREQQKRRKRPAEKEPPAVSSSKGRQPNKRAKHHHKPETPQLSPVPSRHTHHAHHAQPAPPPLPPPVQPIAPPQPAPPPTLATFFDRAKRHIDDRAAHSEFLKLLNLFTQGIIPLRSLIERVRPFFAESRELWAQFCELCGITERDAEGIITGRADMTAGSDIVGRDGEKLLNPLERPKIDIDTCKSFGPSYRKLPKGEINLECSGRDTLCWQVLNDTWISHPTWASEDAGFNTHKKNTFEEAMHRSEEERHEFDYHIEANMRTISLLEPINQRLMTMDSEEKIKLRLPPGLGGQSKGVYARVIKKVYGPENGVEVMQALQDNPAQAVPVVLARLKQKDEEWRRAQRDWNKVWREVEARNFYKSLDHMSASFKTEDKKKLVAKRLIEEIESLKAEQEAKQARDEGRAVGRVRTWQFEHIMDDVSVLQDVLKMVFSFLDRGQGHLAASDRQRVEHFLRSWVPKVYGLNGEEFNKVFPERPPGDESSDEEMEDANGTPMPPPPPRANGHAKRPGGGGRKKAKGSRSAQLRQQREGTETPSQISVGGAASPRAQSHVDSGSGSAGADEAPETLEMSARPLLNIEEVPLPEEEVKEHFDSLGQPVQTSSVRGDPATASGENMDADVGGGADVEMDDPPSALGLHLNGLHDTPATQNGVPQAAESSADSGASSSTPLRSVKPFSRRVFFCNSNYYVLYRFIQTLYSRLHTFKHHVDPVACSKPNPLAVRLGLASESAFVKQDDHFIGKFKADRPISSTAQSVVSNDYVYRKLLSYCERHMDGEIDQNSFEDCARELYGSSAYAIFTFHNALGGIVKHGHLAVSERHNQDLFQLFRDDEERQASLASQMQTASKKAEADARALIAYRRLAEKLIAEGEKLFKLEWIGELESMRIAVVHDDDPSSDPPSERQRWRAYVDSFMLSHPTENVSQDLRRSFLRRNLPPSALTEGRPRLPKGLIQNSDLKIRVSIKTYRLFFVPFSEEWCFLPRDAQQSAEVRTRAGERKDMDKEKMKAWVEEAIRPREAAQAQS